MIPGFALVGAFVALIPGASFILIPMELVMIYLIADKHDAFELPPFLGMCAAIATFSAALKGLVSFLHAVPVIGQGANGLVAYSFIFIVGTLAEKYYSGKSTVTA